MNRTPTRIGVAYGQPGYRHGERVMCQYGIYDGANSKHLYVQYEGTWIGEPFTDDEQTWPGVILTGTSIVSMDADTEPYVWAPLRWFSDWRLFEATT